MLTTREPSWRPLLQDFWGSAEGAALRTFLDAQNVDEVLPVREDWFQALELCPLPAVRVVILGQDPYPTPGHACGLAFSVRPPAEGDEFELPASLANIGRNLHAHTGARLPPGGDLRGWAQQGVLLLNRVLTVVPRRPKSHAGKGWEGLARRVLAAVNALPHTVVFMTWGRDAAQAVTEAGVDRARHTVLATSHPSPKSAKYGFARSSHFAQANSLERALDRPVLDWARAYDPAAVPTPWSQAGARDEDEAEDEIEMPPAPPVKRQRRHAPPGAVWCTGQPGVEQAVATWLDAAASPAIWAHWAVRGVIPVRAQCLDGSRWPPAITTHHMAAVNPLGHVAAELAAAWSAVLTQVRGVLVVAGPAAAPHPALAPLLAAARARLGPEKVHEVADVTAPAQREAAAQWLRALPVPHVAVTGAFALAPEAAAALPALWTTALDSG